MIKTGLTPMMQHYVSLKEQYKDCVLFYRLGDFYELFYEDAVNISKVLDLTLTGKSCGLEERAPMCGIPYHAVETYLNKLVKLGYKIAICEQLTDPNPNSKEIVKRDVVRIVTAGTITSDTMLDEKQNNYILCVNKKTNAIGVAYADLSTGDFYTTEYKDDIYTAINDLIVRINPSEIICNETSLEMLKSLPVNKITKLPNFEIYYNWAFENSKAINTLKSQFGETVLSIYEINEMPNSIEASGALLAYLNETQKTSLNHIKKISKIQNSKYMILDLTARKNLEIVETIRSRNSKGSLISILDYTKTSMGARLFRNWLEQPLKDSTEINLRLNSVEELYANLIFRESLTNEIKKLTDIERLTAKIGMRTIMPKECEKLRNSLLILPNLKVLLSQSKNDKLLSIFKNIKDFYTLQNLLTSAILDDPASHLKDGGYINNNFNQELDELRKLKMNGKDLMTQLEISERQNTNIPNLRIKFNNVYGYYIEVSRTLSGQVPLRYQRKQTVANFDRYFTDELKILEDKITTAEEKAIKLEQKIYNQLKEDMPAYISDLQTTAKAISELDCLISLAFVAAKNNYCKPKINNNIKHIKIIEGRHPVVETYLQDQGFISNDTYLDEKDDKIMIITGPNMAGKSTFMRQVAVITLLAHIGSFVPAKSAEISITDRIFTRVGASDDLAFGQSTFMVEMVEVANIMHNATDNSLIILDEIGRGTSTFDGLSIAWAVVEYLSKTLKSKVLFATHYHELTDLEGILHGVKNYKINVKEINNSIVFLRKIVRGGANRSFGIEVASLAGLPNEIITRAKEISHTIEQQDFNLKLSNSEVNNTVQVKENYAKNSQIINMIKELKIDSLSPLDAFEILQDLIEKSK